MNRLNNFEQLSFSSIKLFNIKRRNLTNQVNYYLLTVIGISFRWAASFWFDHSDYLAIDLLSLCNWLIVLVSKISIIQWHKIIKLKCYIIYLWIMASAALECVLENLESLMCHCNRVFNVLHWRRRECSTKGHSFNFVNFHSLCIFTIDRAIEINDIIDLEQ